MRKDQWYIISWLEILFRDVQVAIYKLHCSAHSSEISSYLFIILILVVRVHLLQGRAMIMLSNRFSLIWGQCRGKVELVSLIF